MDRNKLFAMLAVAFMIFAPMACLVGADSQGETSSNDGEINEGTHILLKDLDKDKFYKLVKPGSMISIPTTAMPYVLAVLFPGINSAILNSKMSIESMDIASLDFNQTHKVASDKSEMVMKTGIKLDIRSITVKLTMSDLAKNTKIVIEPKEMEYSKDLASLSALMFKGDYAKKMTEQLGDKTFGDSITFTISGTVEIYKESSMKLLAADDKNYYYQNGGIFISYTTGEQAKVNPPVSLLQVKTDIKATSKIGDQDITIRNDNNINLKAEVDREYTCDKAKVTKDSVYRDKFKTAELNIKHAVTYNDASNGDNQLDLSSLMKKFCDGQYYKVGKKQTFASDNFMLRENKVPYNVVITQADDEEKAIKLMNDVGVTEGKDGYSHDYKIAEDAANAIKGSDSSTDNTTTVIAIVITVIVVLILVALWYFKFRPEGI